MTNDTITCPQCKASVPSERLTCNKCGYELFKNGIGVRTTSSQNDSTIAAGCLSVVGLGETLLFLGFCSGQNKEKEIAELQSRIETERSYLADYERDCKYGPEESADDIRERSLAEWDAAVGNNIGNIAPDQEWEIRKALGREMGLAPSEVNGWRDLCQPCSTGEGNA
jgi:hypothetical protein